MKTLFNKAKGARSRISEWWKNKDYRGKGYTLANFNIFLMFGLAFSYLTVPLITFIISLSLITSSIFSIHYITIDAQKLEEVVNKLKKDRTTELMKKEQEKSKMELDKDTREAMELLFNNDEKDVETKKQKQTEETAYAPNSSDNTSFNTLFNK